MTRAGLHKRENKTDHRKLSFVCGTKAFPNSYMIKPQSIMTFYDTGGTRQITMITVLRTIKRQESTL